MLQKRTATKTSIFKKQTIIHVKLNIEKNLCRQKRITIEHLLQISVHTDIKLMQEAIYQQKNPKAIPSIPS